MCIRSIDETTVIPARWQGFTESLVIRCMQYVDHAPQTQVVGIAMHHHFNRNTRLFPSDLSIFHSPTDKKASQLQKRSSLLVHRGAHEVPTPRLDARLIRTKLCRVTPDHAHFNVRSSGKIAQLVQFSAKRSSGEGVGGAVD